MINGSLRTPEENPRLGVASVLDGRVCAVGEGPVWRDDDQALWWVDIAGKRILSRSFADGAETTLDLDDEPGAILPTGDGGWLVFLSNEIWHYTPDFAPSHVVAQWPHAAWNANSAGIWRANDAATGPLGEVLCGTMPRVPEDHPKSAFLYMLRGSQLVEIASGVTISNGLGWSCDGGSLYYVDSSTGRVDVFDVGEDRVPHSRRPFVTFPSEWGSPDGLCVDSDDHLWVACWGGSRVQRFTPDGQPAGFIEVPCERVTSCSFIGPELSQLAITTAALGQEDRPAAGLTYVFDTDVTGQPGTKARW
jgi:sugar lactone lactonase YvrE